MKLILIFFYQVLNAMMTHCNNSTHTVLIGDYWRISAAANEKLLQFIDLINEFGDNNFYKREPGGTSVSL